MVHQLGFAPPLFGREGPQPAGGEFIEQSSGQDRLPARPSLLNLTPTRQRQGQSIGGRPARSQTALQAGRTPRVSSSLEDRGRSRPIAEGLILPAELIPVEGAVVVDS